MLCTALLVLTSAAVAQAPTYQSSGYTFSLSAQLVDNTSVCSTGGVNCFYQFPALPSGSTAFTFVTASKADFTFFAKGADGYLYKFAPSFDPLVASAWVQLTGLGTSFTSPAVQDQNDIYALSSSGAVIKANTTMTGWTAVTGGGTHVSVSADGTLLVVNASSEGWSKTSTGVWTKLPGTGYTGKPASINSSQGFILKGTALYKLDLVANTAALVTGISTSSISADQLGHLWFVDGSRHVWLWNSGVPNSLIVNFPGTMDAVDSGSLMATVSSQGTSAFHLNLLGLSITVSGSGAYSYPNCVNPPPPNPQICNATHTMNVGLKFAVGGLQPNGTQASSGGGLTSQLLASTTATTASCDVLDYKSTNCSPQVSGTVTCSIMGVAFVDVGGFFANYFHFAMTEFQQTIGTEICHPSVPTGAVAVCDAAVTPHCTIETTPPSFNTSTVANVFKATGQPTYYEFGSECYKAFGIWYCPIGVELFQTSGVTLPLDHCTKLQ